MYIYVRIYMHVYIYILYIFIYIYIPIYIQMCVDICIQTHTQCLHSALGPMEENCGAVFSFLPYVCRLGLCHQVRWSIICYQGPSLKVSKNFIARSLP